MGLKITIKGKVHDVGYRLLLMNIADSLLIEKFEARNVKINGKEAVIVLVDGDEDQLKEFTEKVKAEKPELAVVEDITVEDYSGRIMDIERFRAGFNTLQLSKIVQAGLQMLQKQDLMLQKQDETIREVRAVREEVRETREEVKAVKEELRATREELKQEIRSVGEEVKNVSAKLDKTNELLEKRFEKLEQEIERIKKALIKAGIEV